MTKYVGKCLCGNLLTQAELDNKQCAKCERNIASLAGRWQYWHPQQNMGD